jgi:predicted transcriptional regulator
VATTSSPVSVNLSPDISDQITVLAKALDRPRSWVIEQAVKDFIEVQNWHLAAIDEGIKAADEGRVVSHDDVGAWVGPRITPPAMRNQVGPARRRPSARP